MHIFNLLSEGFLIALTPTNLLFCLMGVSVGTAIGALPGIGPSATIAILIPFTYGKDPTGSMIMLAGIYYGAMYGGSITSILVNTPGESASVMTCLDGHAMALQGRAGSALGICAVASFIAGTVGLVGLMILAPVLSSFAVSFGPAEYFALMFLGLTAVAALVGRSLLKAILSALFGLMFSTVGLDNMTGVERFTYSQMFLLDGIPFVAAAMGLFAVSEVVINVEEDFKIKILKTGWRDVYPSRQDYKDCIGAFWRGSLLGFIIGVLPGAGATISSFMAYALEKKVSKRPEKFGHGAIEGVAAPEGANNSATAGAMVPLFTLGIPGSGSTAMLLGALMMYGLRPGPLLMVNNPDFFWGVVASMYIGNVLLLIMNMPLVPLFARLLRVPYRILGPAIILFCVVGVYSLRNNPDHLWLLFFFSIVGYFMKRLDYPLAPLILSLVLGPLVEINMKRALQISHGDFSVFFLHPIAGSLMAVAILILLTSAFVHFHGRRPKAVSG